MLLLDLNTLLLVLGSILAISGLIVARRPDARAVLEGLTPFQALIGAGLLVLAIVNLVRVLPKLTDMFKANLLQNAAILAVLGCSALLGALFAMPAVARLVPDGQAQHKATQMAQQLAPYQVMLGLIGLAASLVYFLYRLHILTLSA